MTKNELWWIQVKLWSTAVTFISFLSACFILNSLVIHNNSMFWKIGKRLSKLQEFHNFSSLTCEKEEENWSCCPTFWKPFQSSCYFVSTTPQSWTESQKNCSMMEAELTVINTKEEQNFIIQHLNEDSAYYMGLTDPEGQGHWQWVDQSPYDESATFWHAGEPNDPRERCVVVNFRSTTKKWGWNDIHCHSPEKAICKMMKIAGRGGARL